MHTRDEKELVQPRDTQDRNRREKEGEKNERERARERGVGRVKKKKGGGNMEGGRAAIRVSRIRMEYMR